MQTTTTKTGKDLGPTTSSRSKRTSTRKDDESRWRTSTDPWWDVDTMETPPLEGIDTGVTKPVQATVLAPTITSKPEPKVTVTAPKPENRGAAGETKVVEGETKQTATTTTAGTTAAPVDPTAVTEETTPSGESVGVTGTTPTGESAPTTETVSKEETKTTEGERTTEGAPTAEGEEPKDGADTKEGEEAPKEKVAPESTTPRSPEEDPEFQAVKQDTDVVAKGQRKHGKVDKKVAESHDAAVEPKAAIVGKGQERHVGEMQKAPTPDFDAAGFKQALLERIAALAPKNLEEADEFKENDKLGSVKNTMGNRVDSEASRTQKDLAHKTKETPSTSGLKPKPVKDLPDPGVGKAPGSIGADRAVPKTRTESTVEAPLRADSESLDRQMSEANVTDEQLAKSNEPTFTGALDAKNEAQTHAAEDPKAFRQLETQTLTSAKATAVAVAQKEVSAMHGSRKTNLKGMESNQVQAKGKDEEARTQIASKIDGMFNDTKSKVESILNGIEGLVMPVFNNGADGAKRDFESYVDREMNAYKDRRYSGLAGKARWVRDLFLPLPSEVNAFYLEGRRLYINSMDRVLDNVVGIIGRELSAAKTAIKNGKTAITDYVNSLPASLKQIGRDAAKQIDKKFDDLEKSVDAKQSSLIDTLAQKYQENLAAIDARIEEMKAANQGLIGLAVTALTEVIETIKKLSEMLTQVLAKVAEVVGMILMDPIGFLGSLIEGVAAGFNNFVANIQKHLIGGLFGWLTGAMGPMGITIPEDIFSLQGIFTLVMQVLGLSWNFIRTKAVKLFGEPVVGAMEKGVEIFAKLREGPAAVWEYVKEEFSDLKEMVLDQIKSIIISEVIEAGVKWVLGLLTPAGAFVKAAMMIYDFLSFIFSRAAQIADFINAMLDAVAAIAKGAVGGAAGLIETALAKSVPVIIGLLASLLGISDLVGKVQKIIQKIHKRIEAAIEKLLTKARKLLKKVFGKGDGEDVDKKKGDEEKPEGPDERTPEQKKRDLNDGLADAFSLLRDKKTPLENLDDGLDPIKNRYRMEWLKFVVVGRNEAEGTERVKAVGKVNPEGESEATDHEALRILVQSHKPLRYDRRNQTYTIESGSYKGQQIRINEFGFPDFSPFAVVSVTIEMKGNRDYVLPDGDFGKANLEAGFDRSLGEKKAHPNHTWHHHEDRRTMQLIPTDLHEEFRHSGGVWVIKHLGVR